MFRLGHDAGKRPIDQLRPGLFQVVLDRLRALNANTRLLLRLLEDPDWGELRSRALRHVRSRIVR